MYGSSCFHFKNKRLKKNGVKIKEYMKKKNQIFWCCRDYIHQHVFLFYRDISSNSLGGNIPASIGKLYNLKNLYVDFFSAMAVLSLRPFFFNFYFLNVYFNIFFMLDTLQQCINQFSGRTNTFWWRPCPLYWKLVSVTFIKS